MQKLDLDTLMNEELGEEELPVQPEQRTDFIGMPLRGRPNTLEETMQDAKELPFAIADFAAAMLPGAGVSEAVGTGVENPVSAAVGKEEAMPIPSLKQDVEEGNYLDAGLKTLGAAGDALTVAGAGMALTGIGSAPGAAMMATGLAAKGIAKYGDDVAKSLQKLFDVDEDAAKVAAERLDQFAEQDRPDGHAIQMVKGALKKAKANQTAAIGHNNPPRVTAPTRELGLFNRAEEAVANMDIPDEGIRADALMARLKDDPDVPNDEVDVGLGLMVNPEEMLTRERIDELFGQTFGIKETVLKGDDVNYGDYPGYRLPDEQGSDYTEVVFQARTAVPLGEDSSSAALEFLDAMDTSNLDSIFDADDALRDIAQLPLDAPNKEIAQKYTDYADAMVGMLEDAMFSVQERTGLMLDDVELEYMNDLEPFRDGVKNALMEMLQLQDSFLKMRTEFAEYAATGVPPKGGGVTFTRPNRLIGNPFNTTRKLIANRYTSDRYVPYNPLTHNYVTRLEGIQEELNPITARDDELLRAAPSADLGMIKYEEDAHFLNYSENQIGHMRTSVRTTDDGRRVLMVEEIQSDAFKEDGAAAGMDDIPFKSKAGYTNMALARAMRMAAEQDLDGIMIMNAAEQIKRNKDTFSGVVNTMESRTVPAGKNIVLDMKDGSVTQLIVNKKGIVEKSSMNGLEGKKLSEVIDSKSTADKLLKEDTVMDAEDRVIGDSGYKAVYDNRIPARLNQIVKRMDADGKVDKGSIVLQGRSAYKEGGIMASAEDYIYNKTLITDDISVGSDDPDHTLIAMLMDDGMARFDDVISDVQPDEFLTPFSTVDDVLEGEIIRLRNNITTPAYRLQLAHPEKFKTIDDAEEFVEKRMEKSGRALREKLNDRILELAKANDNAVNRTVSNNTRLMFTPEMKAEILGKGLPRLRKGGLVSQA